MQATDFAKGDTVRVLHRAPAVRAHGCTGWCCAERVSEHQVLTVFPKRNRLKLTGEHGQGWVNLDCDRWERRADGVLALKAGA